MLKLTTPPHEGFLRFVRMAFALAAASGLGGCAGFISNSGPAATSIQNLQAHPQNSDILVVELTPEVARNLCNGRAPALFSDKLPSSPRRASILSSGDSLEISVLEAAPASLFSSGAPEGRAAMGGARLATLPEQMINAAGTINVPFAGQVGAAGRSIDEIEQEITKQLKEKANQPQVLVRQTRNTTAHVTVVGEVNQSVRLPVTPAGERLLDAIATAGGTRQPINKITIQITRGSSVHSLPLETIVADPRQNIPLQPGDVIAVLSLPLSFTALGATGKNEEVNFEAKGINLAQALARAGGLADSRSNSRGVFIFRYETVSEPTQLQASKSNTAGTKPNTSQRNVTKKVPTIYRLNLRDPASFFLAKTFPMNDGDVLYVSNAPAAELQKFVNIITSVAYPVMSTAATSAALNH